MLRGKLPNQAELDAYKSKLKSLRNLPESLKLVLEQIPPKDAHPMDVMRTGCSMLGNLETEQDFSEQDDKIDRMLAVFPAIITYWYRFAHEGIRIDTANTECDSIGGVFLELLHGKKPSELHERVMNVSLILYAEHEFNASTFTARVCASTLSDIHSCVTGAIGSLRGPLHGGANEAAMELIQKFKTPPEEAEAGLMGMLERKEKKSWASDTPSTANPTRAMPLSKSGLKSWPRKSAIPCCTRFPFAVRKSCGARRSCSVTPTSSTPRPITSWAFRPSCSRPSS